jgi:tetratricopeptide (TPR) repeat protein/Mrp family chromosome partitioning ATPase
MASIREDSPAPEPLGNIITFYSYKGGTGRSMTLANIAWILASSGKRVLTVDWDLEAPGLHRYFAPFLNDKDLTGSEGLIDLLLEFRDATAIGVPGESDDKWHEAYADISPYVVSLDWDFPRNGTLDLLPAGRQGASYSARVNSFDWVEFYERRGGGVFLETIKEKMRADYDYVLIDSRTGVSDTSGICTVQMPDAVVVCFTLNNQGIQGSAAVSHSIYEQRLRKGRDIAIFPVPMRVEPFEKVKLDTRREYAKRMFEVFPAHLAPQSRAQFQEDTQVKYLPYYAYEEILATFGNRPGESESTSLLAPSERLAGYLTDYLDGEVISRLEASEYLESRRQSILAQFEGQQATADLTQLLLLSADAAWAGLKPEDERIARRALLRMVRLADVGEQGGDSRLLLRLSKFDRATEAVLRNLATTPLVTVENDTAPGEALIQIASDELLRHWSRLQSWIQEDREFLLWRQKLNVAILEWRRLGEDNGALLGGAPLELARQWQAGRAENLNESETDYINRCVAEEERRIREHEEREKRHADEREELIKISEQSQRRRRTRTAIIAVVALLALSLAGGRLYQQRIWRDRAIDLTTDANVDAKENGDRAITKYTQAIGVDPSYAPAYYGRGRAYFDKTRYDEALADFKEAIKLDAKNTGAYIGCGDVYWQKRDLNNALEAYSQAIGIEPLSEAYTGRGKVLAEQRKLEDAVKDYNRAIDISQAKNPDAFLWRGEARSMTGDYNGAIEDFDQAINLKPNQSEAYIKRGDALLKRGRPEDSGQVIKDLDTGLGSAPVDTSYDPTPILNRGLANRNIGKIVEASSDFEKAVKLSQNKPEYSKIKDEAIKQLRVIKPNPTPPPNIQTQGPLVAPTIYIRYRDARDEQTLNRILAIIKKQSMQSRKPEFTVADGLQLVTGTTTGDVRYFHQEDEAMAAKIKDNVEGILKFIRIEKTLELKPMLRLRDRPPQGWIEVWLPSLPAPSPLKKQFPFYQQNPKAQAND